MERDREEFAQILSDFADYLDQEIVRPAVEDISAAAEQIDPHKPKRKRDMWSEYFRESAVLILVFLPVDLVIPRLLDPQRGLSHPWIWFIATLALSLTLMLIGIRVERS